MAQQWTIHSKTGQILELQDPGRVAIRSNFTPPSADAVLALGTPAYAVGYMGDYP